MNNPLSSKNFFPQKSQNLQSTQQNPQQLYQTNAFKPSQITIDNRFDTEMIRIKVQHHSRITQSLFKISQSELSAVMMEYETLPYSSINIKNLINSKNCKLIKSSKQKIYLGETLNKKKHGHGVAIYKDGRVYQGNFFENQRNGYGVEVYSNGNIYIGNFHQNKKHGKGVFFWFSLSEIPCTKSSEILIQHYKGTWWGGLPDGKGQHYRSNGDIYIGEFKNGLKHGKGIEHYAIGDFYEGDFINGLCEGNGLYLWNDGSEYNGDFKQGYRNGYGIWKNKHKDEVYQGHYMLDKKHGYGIYTWGNGYTYKGNYVQDQRSGQGKLLFQVQTIYDGMWINGQKVDDIQNQSRKNKSFSASRSHYSALTKSTNMQNGNKQIKSRLYSDKQKSIQKPFNRSGSKQKKKSMDKTQKSSKQRYCVSFKNEQKKEKVGHRNCIPCQQIKQMRQNSRLQRQKQRNKFGSVSKK